MFIMLYLLTPERLYSSAHEVMIIIIQLFITIAHSFVTLPEDHDTLYRTMILQTKHN